MAGGQVRNELHNDLTRVIGATSAGALMEMLPPFPWHEIATKEFVRNECEMVRAEVGGKIDKLGGKIDKLGGRIDGIQGQINELTAEVRAGNREFFAGLITAYFLMSIALAGLILAAVSLTR